MMRGGGRKCGCCTGLLVGEWEGGEVLEDLVPEGVLLTCRQKEQDVHDVAGRFNCEDKLSLREVRESINCKVRKCVDYIMFLSALSPSSIALNHAQSKRDIPIPTAKPCYHKHLIPQLSQSQLQRLTLTTTKKLLTSSPPGFRRSLC